MILYIILAVIALEIGIPLFKLGLPMLIERVKKKRE